MKILFLVKFYMPFDRGGSEWSTHDLAKLLTARGHKVTILTPNYGAKKEERLDGIAVKRFPFFKTSVLPPDIFTYKFLKIFVPGLFLIMARYDRNTSMLNIFILSIL